MKFCCRSGTYELSEAGDVDNGTKIVIHLKDDCSSFSDEDTVKGCYSINQSTFRYFILKSL
jgi:hypothetical protein